MGEHDETGVHLGDAGKVTRIREGGGGRNVKWVVGGASVVE